MSTPIFYIDKSAIRDGRLNELKAAIKELVGFIEAHVPRLIAYSVYLNADETQMTVVQLQPDSASLESHMDVGGPAFAKFKDLIRLTAMEVYGEPTETLRKKLIDKARMLGGSDEIVTFHSRQAGFSREGREGRTVTPTNPLGGNIEPGSSIADVGSIIVAARTSEPHAHKVKPAER